jgi:hypothetical protein
LLALPLVSRVQLGSWHARLGFDSIPLVFCIVLYVQQDNRDERDRNPEAAAGQLGACKGQFPDAGGMFFSAKEKFSKKDLTV